MDLDSLKSMATPGSYIDQFLQDLECRLPISAMNFLADHTSTTELHAVATFLYEIFGFDLLIYDWRLYTNYDGALLLDYLPLTQADCRKLVALGVDTNKGQILKQAYPDGSLPLSIYRQFSLPDKAYCLEYYPVSKVILDYEMTQLDSALEDRDNALTIDDWLWNLWEALLQKGRPADAKQVKAVRDQLAKRENW